MLKDVVWKGFRGGVAGDYAWCKLLSAGLTTLLNLCKQGKCFQPAQVF
jgi:hypothetical protein